MVICVTDIENSKINEEMAGCAGTNEDNGYQVKIIFSLHIFVMRKMLITSIRKNL